jgi:mRNA interferase MazF
MEKDFDAWNIKKKAIDFNSSRIFCYPREIWWCSIGVNIGFEQNGTGEHFDRPVIVIRNFGKNAFWGAFLTSKMKSGPYYFPIGIIEGRSASVILSQIRFIDTKRLIKKSGVLEEGAFKY